MNLAEKRRTYHQNYTLLLGDDDLNFQAYTFQKLDICLLMVFVGRAAKPKIHYKYSGADALKNATEKANEMLSEARANKAVKTEKKEVKLNVGDVLVCSWGYDQTNIDYYQVTKLIGKQSVGLREIDKSSTPSSVSMTGTCTPLPYSFIGEEFTRRVVDGETVKVGSHQYASLKSFELVDSKRVYKADTWTAYA